MTNSTGQLRVVITGANRGIGLSLCELYVKKGAEVLAICRRASKELEALGIEIIDSVDVSSAQAMDILKQKIAGRDIDVLINNAGILRSQSFDNLNYQEMTEQFQVNTLGPIRVVEALFDSLSQGSKVAFITSRMGSIADNTSGGQYGYRMSKGALNVAGQSMAVDFKPKGIAVALLHPGYVQTEMVNFGGEIAPALSAERLIQRINDLNLDNTGTFWHSNGEVLPW